MQPAPACVTVNVCPPIVIVPIRWVAEVFAATVYETVPAPDPVAPLAIEIHDALLAAVQLQPVGAVTLVVFDSPAAVAVRLVGVSE